MNPEDASEQEVPGTDSPDGIIEIEYFDVSSVSDVEASGMVATDGIPDGIIETETYDIPDSSEMAYNSETLVAEQTTVTAKTPSGTLELSVNKTSPAPQDSEEVAPSSMNEPATSTTPVSNMTNEASSMANPSPTTPPSNPGGSFEEWVITPDANAWPPPVFIKKNANPKERFYLEHRWHSQWHFYDKKATENKNTYYDLQRIVVIGSLIIPALISLNSTIARFINEFIGKTDASENIIRIGVDAITVIISLAVAGAASLESLYKFGENWSSYRSAAEELQAEKNFYDMGAGPYATSANPFGTFVDRIEGIIANQNGKYFQAVQAQIAKQTEENEEIVASFKDIDDEFELSITKQPTSTASQEDVVSEPEPEV